MRGQTDLQDEQTQEVEVGRPLELLIQVQGQEGQHVVLVRLDGVALQTRGQGRGQGQPGLRQNRPHWEPNRLCGSVSMCPQKTLMNEN